MAKRKSTKVPATFADAKLVSWTNIAPKSVFPLEKGSQAGVVIDRKGVPRLFIFDTFALLDVLSEIDERLVDELSHEAYASRKVNPAGWLIGELESKLPLNEEYVQSLKNAIAEANRKGWIPFEKIERQLNLA